MGGGQQLAAELVRLSGGGSRQGEICMSRLLNSGTMTNEANRQPGWEFLFEKKWLCDVLGSRSAGVAFR